MRTLIRALVMAGVALLGVGVFVLPADAHERRQVGQYVTVVGFATEPAYVEQPNGVSITVATADGKPVEGLENTLKVEISTGGASKTLNLKRVFNRPGAYVAEFIPTKSGAYSFRFFGTIEGQDVNEKFDSGPNRFDDVIGTADLQFPSRVPTNGELAAQGGSIEGPSSQSDVQKALDEAGSARRTGLIVGGLGLLAGLAGIAIGVYALRSYRSRA